MKTLKFAFEINWPLEDPIRRLGKALIIWNDPFVAVFQEIKIYSYFFSENEGEGHGHGESGYQVFHMEFDRVELPFIIALWIFVSSLAKIGKNQWIDWPPIHYVHLRSDKETELWITYYPLNVLYGFCEKNSKNNCSNLKWISSERWDF